MNAADALMQELARGKQVVTVALEEAIREDHRMQSQMLGQQNSIVKFSIYHL